MKKNSALALFLLLCACVSVDDSIESELRKEEALLAPSVANGRPTQSYIPEIYRPKDNEKVVYHTDKETVVLREDYSERIENHSKIDFTPANQFDRIALQMAGLYVTKGLEHSRAYFSYMKFLETEWARLKHNSTAYITEWAQKNLETRVTYEDTVFYPFGGPDIVYAISFFPNASNYILIGLEPIGTFSDIEKNINNPETFESIKKALRTYMRGGYFITSEMVTNLSRRFLRGTLYLILLELSSLGFEINNVEDLSLDKAGNEVARGHGMADCVKITCTKRGEAKPRTVYYIRADLSDSNTCLQNIFNFAKKYNFHTFFKSASYAIWDRTLTKARKFVLDNSKFILQDDTGVPFHYFDRKWTKFAFGTYTEPTLDLFKGYRQPNMAEFFRKNSQDSIPFKIGYGFYKARPNLLLAVPRGREKVAPLAVESQQTEDNDKAKTNSGKSDTSAEYDNSVSAISDPIKSDDGQLQERPLPSDIDRTDIVAQVEELKKAYQNKTPCPNCTEQSRKLIKTVGV